MPKNKANFLHTPFSFYANQIIIPFLSSLDEASHHRVEGFFEKFKENMDKNCP